MRKDDKYFNTTNEVAEAVKTYENVNTTQNERVLQIYKKAKRPLSPSQVWERFGGVVTPLTSIRRAITQLMIAKLLVKTDFKRVGLYGRSEHYYDLPETRKKKKAKEK